MIPSVCLAKSGIVTSRLGFGTSRLHYLAGRERLDLLGAAADFGFVHFDSAPAYGDGLAETVLSDFLRRERDRFVVATKYGIPANLILRTFPQLGMPLRGARAIARRAGLWRFSMPPLSAAGLRASAEQSLRRLKIDRIDILFLHEPSLDRLRDPSQMMEEFQRLRQRGLIRAYGLAGSWSAIAPILVTTPGLGDVVQTSESDWPESLRPDIDITYGALSGSAQSYFNPVLASHVAAARLRAALLRRPNGIVLVSTTKRQNLSVLAKEVEAIA